MVKSITISMNENFLENIDKRRKELAIGRSEYLRGLVIKDLERGHNHD